MGKSTLLSTLAGEPSDNLQPTMGFAIKAVLMSRSILNIKELGGSDRIRPYWDKYYSGHEAVVSQSVGITVLVCVCVSCVITTTTDPVCSIYIICYEYSSFRVNNNIHLPEIPDSYLKCWTLVTSRNGPLLGVASIDHTQLFS